MPSEVCSLLNLIWGFPGGSEVKASACNARDLGSIPGSERSPGEGNGNPFQYSCLENPMDGGAWWATVHGVAKSWTQLSDFTSLLYFTSLHFPFLNLALLPIISRGKHSTQGHLLVVEISKTVYRDQAMMLSLWVTANQETGKSGRAPFPI